MRKSEAQDRTISDGSRFDTVEAEIQSAQNQYQAMLQGITQQSAQLVGASDDDLVRRVLAAWKENMNLMRRLPDARPQEVIPRMQRTLLREQLLTLEAQWQEP